jgi:hypothetical protein
MWVMNLPAATNEFGREPSSHLGGGPNFTRKTEVSQLHSLTDWSEQASVYAAVGGRVNEGGEGGAECFYLT